jgi:hypothetical protein
MHTRTPNLDTSSQGIRFGSALLEQLRELAWRKKTTVSELCREVMAAYARSQQGVLKVDANRGDSGTSNLDEAFEREMKKWG